MTSTDHPRLKPGLRFLRRVEEGRAFFVVKDPVRMRYFRFGETEVVLMRLLDGERSLGDVAATMGARTEAVAAFVRRLKEMGVVERSVDEQRLLLMESLRKERKLRLQGHGNTLLRMRFSFGDPDALFDRIIHRIRFLFTPGFIAVSVVAFLAYGVVVTLHWDAVVAGLARFYDPSQYSLAFLGSVYLMAGVLFLSHELGHGLACKHFGGEVHEMGAMLFYFSPAFFCNVNDAWTFEKLSHRLWVTFAGGWIQLFLGAIAALIWIIAEPGTLVEQLAFMGILLGGGIILLVNFNPLLPLDGYYALMDGLKIPNLRPRSFQYVAARFRRALLGPTVAVPSVTPRERRIFLAYGIASMAYTTLVLTTVATFLGGMVVRALGGWGWALIAFALWRVLRHRLRAAARTARAWVADRVAPARRRWLLGAAATTVSLLIVGLLPWTVRASGPATVEPLARVWVRATEDGIIDRILVRQGDTVRAGQPLLELRSPDLELELGVAAAAIASLEREVEAARAAGRSADARRGELDLQARHAQLDALHQRRTALSARAPFDAVVVTPHLQERIHSGAQPGDSLLELWSVGPLRARIALAQRDAGELRAGATVRIRFPAHTASTWRSRIDLVAPATHNGHVEALAPLGDADLRPGMTGRARIKLHDSTVAGALIRRLRMTFRTDWLL